jgi:hypothetical protein
VAGKVLTVRLPFGENNERADLLEGALKVRGGGKADPVVLWKEIDSILASADFSAYVSALTDAREKIISFDLERCSWATIRDWYSIDSIKAGAYPGLPHTPAVLVKGRDVAITDVYNYLFCVGRVGMDCSGFVWYLQKSIAATGGIDLDRVLGISAGVPRSMNPSLYIGTWFFDPRNRNLEQVRDEVRNLRPGDVILFKGEDGTTRHSAVIQSIDMTKGTIRYLQCTDEAPQEERGVHESSISFDPAKPKASLKDPFVIWRQRLSPPFPGELGVVFRDDGERYRATSERGGGTIVRLKTLKKVIEKLSSSKSKK